MIILEVLPRRHHDYSSKCNSLRSATMIILLFFIIQANAKAKAPESVDVLVDKLVGKLVNSLLNRKLQELPMDYADLDKTTLQKLGHPVISIDSHRFLPLQLKPSLQNLPVFQPVTKVQLYRSPHEKPTRIRGECLAKALQIERESSGSSTSMKASGVKNVRKRILRDKEDVPRLAALCAEAFSASKLTAILSVIDCEVPPVLNTLDAMLEKWDSRAIRLDFITLLNQRLDLKNTCAKDTRVHIEQLREAAMEKELSALNYTSMDNLTSQQVLEVNKRITDVVASSLEEELKSPSSKTMARRRARQWITLMAEGMVEGVKDLEKKLVLGSVTVRVRERETFPELPSCQPYCFYISNLAVSERARRCGIATSLIRSAERVARLWGYDEIWLQVRTDNTAAQALYDGLGYDCVQEDPWFYLDRNCLFKRKL